MPELPEVETVRRGLMPAMEGQVVKRVMLHRANLRYPFHVDFQQRLEGKRVLSLQRRAKYLRLEMEDIWLIMHLGMSGSFRLEGQMLGEFHHKRGAKNHDHVEFMLQNGMCVIYNDPRRFGFMLFEDEPHAPDFTKLGVEPMSNAFSCAYLMDRFLGKLAPLKHALMAQENVAGLGNIYVCEALFLAKLSPFTPAHLLDEAGCLRLIHAINLTLEAAIKAGGSSLNDHKQVNGELGYFQHRFHVYDREGEACLSCQSPIQRARQQGRSTFYCVPCQGVTS